MKRTLTLAAVLLWSRPAEGQSATATQAVLSYAASTTSQCQVEVSTSNTYSPLVHAVDPALFTNANMDGQTNAGARQFVVGQKWIAQENASPPAITVAIGNASRTLKLVTVTSAGHPFVVGDNVTVTGAGGDATLEDAWARVDTVADSSHFAYETVPSGTATNAAALTITRADRYSLALATNTTYFYRVGGASNTCGASGTGMPTGSFTTMNIPNGNTWAEVSVVDSNFTQLEPSIFEDRTTTYNDPLTGILVKRITLYGDSNTFAASSGSKFRDCSIPLSNGGVHCWVGMGGSNNARLYWVCRTSPTCSNGASLNTVRFLGTSAVSFTDANNKTFSTNLNAQTTSNDTTDPNRFYVITPTNNQAIPWKNVLGYVEYNGNDVSAANGANWSTATSTRPPGNVTPLTPDPTTLSDMEDACVAGTGVYSPPGSVCHSDPLFLAAKFPGCGQVQVIGASIQYQCLSRTQDSVGWLFVYSLTTGNLIAGAPTYANSTSRWCGEHGTIDSESANWYVDSPKTQGSGTGNSQYDVTVTSSLTNVATSFTVTGAADGTIGEPQNIFPVPRSDNTSTWNYLQPALGGSGGQWGGDVFTFQDTGEKIRLLTKSLSDCSGQATCNWTSVTRGVYGTTAKPHSANVVLAADCEEEDRGVGPLYWNTATDPTRSDTTNAATFIHGQKNSASHGWNRSPNFALDAGIWDNHTYGTDYTVGNSSTVGSLLGPPNFSMGLTQSFSGIATDSPTGSAFQNYENWDAETASFQDFALISFYFVGAGGYGGFYTNVTGNIYKMTLPFSDVTPKGSLPYAAMNGINRMVDISAPSSVLPNTSSNEFCMAFVAGECWSGSAVGNMYADFTPDSGGATHCTISGEGLPYTGSDLCVFNPPMFGMRIAQEGLVAGNQVGTGTFYGFPNISISDFSKSRGLVGTFYGPMRQQSGFIHTVPDGGALDFNSCMADPHLSSVGAGDQNVYGCHQYLAIIPPQPTSDGLSRNNYLTVPVAVGAVGASPAYAILQYGYEENEQSRGTTSPPTIHFYCTQYQGTCYWKTTGGPAYSAATATQLSLNSTTNLQLGVPQRVLAYKLLYFNGSNVQVGTGPVQFLVTDSLALPQTIAPPVITGATLVNGASIQ